MSYQYAEGLELFAICYPCNETILTHYCHLQGSKYNRQQQHVNRCHYQGGSSAKILEVSINISLKINFLINFQLTVLKVTTAGQITLNLNIYIIKQLCRMHKCKFQENFKLFLHTFWQNK